MVWFLKKCCALKFLSTLLLMLVCGQSYATIYYLKFTSSGASHSGNSTFKDNAGAWLEVSIVDTHPTDGPIHWKNSQTGSFTGESASGHKKRYGTYNNLQFYYADVPRSLTVIENSSGTPTTITAGSSPVRFTSAPSFLLPDGLLVASGVSQYPARNIYVIAAMPIRFIPATDSYEHIEYRGNHSYHRDSGKNDRNCLQGWTEAALTMGSVEIWQAVESSNSSADGKCASSRIYRGPLSHIVLER